MDDDKIREGAYKKWEQEGRPEGEHERHWSEAEEQHRRHTGSAQTMPSDHNSGVSPPTSAGAAGGSQPEEPSNDWPAAEKG
jgi:hypothetical protein